MTGSVLTKSLWLLLQKKQRMSLLKGWNQVLKKRIFMLILQICWLEIFILWLFLFWKNINPLRIKFLILWLSTLILKDIWLKKIWIFLKIFQIFQNLFLIMRSDKFRGFLRILLIIWSTWMNFVILIILVTFWLWKFIWHGQIFLMKMTL